MSLIIFVTLCFIDKVKHSDGEVRATCVPDVEGFSGMPLNEIIHICPRIIY